MNHFTKIYNRSLGKNLWVCQIFAIIIFINQSHPLNQVDFPLSSTKQNQVLIDVDELNTQYNAKPNTSDRNGLEFILKELVFTALLSFLVLCV